MIVKYKDISVFYTEEGKGNAVVLLHGFLENSGMWQPLVPELAKKNRVICVDLLGHGRTECVGYVHTMEEMAEAVRMVLKEIQVSEAIFIGHSMGGYVALALAKKYSAYISGICLMNSTSQADTKERKELRQSANEMAKKNLEMLVSMGIPNLFTPASKIKYATEVAEVLKEAKKTSVRGYIAANEGMLQRTCSEKIVKQFSKRAIIVGKKDPILNYESIVAEASRTQTPLVELENGHMSHIEDTAALLHFLVNFIG